MALVPPAGAHPGEIALVSGVEPPPANSWPGFAVIRSGSLVEFLLATGPTVPVGKVFRLDVKVKSRDCEGRAITTKDCVQVVIGSC